MLCVFYFLILCVYFPLFHFFRSLYFSSLLSGLFVFITLYKCETAFLWVPNMYRVDITSLWRDPLVCQVSKVQDIAGALWDYEIEQLSSGITSRQCSLLIVTVSGLLQVAQSCGSGM